MLHTYEALLKGDRLEWIGSVPEEVAGDSVLPVRVTILGKESDQVERSSERMVQALEEIALADPPTQIQDPVEWQREIRRDRSLPGRED